MDEIDIARQGFRVLLLEEHRRVGVPSHCSGLISPRTLALGEMGDGIVINQVQGAYIHTVGGQEVALGAVGITVEKKEDVPKAIAQMLAEKQPCVVDFRVEREENVWPMVPACKSLSEMDGLTILESMA